MSRGAWGATSAPATASTDETAPALDPEAQSSSDVVPPAPPGEAGGEVVPPPKPKTLKEDFKAQKKIALVGLVASALLFCIALIAGYISTIANCVAGGVGVLAFIFYFVAGNAKGVHLFLTTASVGLGVSVAVLIYNVAMMVHNFNKWIESVQPAVYVIVKVNQMLLLIAEALTLGWVGWKGWRMAHGAARAEKMLRQAQEYAQRVG